MATCDAGALQLAIWNSTSLTNSLNTFHLHYINYHKYVSTILCVYGILTNILNAIVLSRPSMRTGINAILSCIAICDSIVMLSYFVFTVRYKVFQLSCEPSSFSYGWALFVILHNHTSVVLHTSSMWLSVLLALIRTVALSVTKSTSTYMVKFNTNWNMAWLMNAAAVGVVTLVTSPSFLSLHIVSSDVTSMCPNMNTTGMSRGERKVYHETWTALTHHNNCFLFKFIFWTHGTMFKLLPCILLILLLINLVRMLAQASERHQRLMNKSHSRSVRKSRQTTNMLVVVLFLTLITEVPQGILSILAALFGTEFRQNVYINLGDVADLLSLINSSVNFVVYCSMSEAFRNEFLRTFFCREPKSIEDQIERAAQTLISSQTALRAKEMGNSATSWLRSNVPRLIFLRTVKERQSPKRQNVSLEKQQTELVTDANGEVNTVAETMKVLIVESANSESDEWL